MTHRAIRVAALTFTALLICGAAQSLAQEWTRFRGPNGSGASDTDVPLTFTSSDINWKVETAGKGHCSPVLWGDKIFITGVDTAGAKRIVQCLDAKSGRSLWTKAFPFANYHIHDQNSFATSTPAVDEKNVYVAWASPEEGALVALTHGGEEIWRVDIGKFVSQHGFASSPIVYKDLVILSVEQDGPSPEGGGRNPNDTDALDGKSAIWAVDRRDGKLVWKTPRKTTIVPYATPVVHKQADGKEELIFDSRSHGIAGIDPASGKQNWELPVFDRRAVGSAILVDDLILGACGVGSGNNTLFAVRPGDKTQAAKVVYKVDKSGAPYVPTPVAKGDLVFVWNDRGVVTCIDAQTGHKHWQERVDGNYSSSPVRAADKIIGVSTDGNLTVFAAAADKYNLLGRLALSETCRSTPALAMGHVFLRTESHLVSIGGAKP